jgi:glycerate kinase
LTLKILIAPDKFKGTLSAHEVAGALAAGFPSEAHVKLMPLADGGDGSIDAIVAAGFEVIELDPLIPSATTYPDALIFPNQHGEGGMQVHCVRVCGGQRRMNWDGK